MATNFPTSLDNLSNPAGSDPINNPSHAVQHANVNDAIEALESKVGVTNSAVTSTLDYRVRSLETNPTYTNEMAQDAVAAALAAGTHTNITINYNDTGNSISISAAAGYTNEEAVDAVAAALTAGSGISISYNDPANTITISVDNSIATKSYVDTAITSLGNTAATTYVPQSDVGNIDGVASLDGTGKVPDAQIPEGIARDSEVSSAISTEVTNRNSAISTAINNLINSAPGTLDTLGEIATALATSDSAAAALTTVVNGKVSKAGGDIIQSSLSTVIPLVVKGAASQTVNLQEWQDSTGAIKAKIGPSGGMDTGGTLGAQFAAFGASRSYIDNTALRVLTNGSNVGVIVKSYSGNTANLQEWQNSSGTVLAKIDATGLVSVGSTTGTIQVASSGSSGAYPSSGAGIEIVAGALSGVDLIQSYNRNAGTWRQLGINTGKTTFNVSGIEALTITSNSVGFFNPTVSNVAMGIIPPSATAQGIVVRAFSGQTANLQEWQNSAGTVLAAIEPNGSFYGSSITAYGILTSNSSFRVNNASAGTVAAIVKGAASQTANLQEWQDSSGTLLANLASNGSFFINSTGTSNDPITVQRASSTRFKVDPYGNVFAGAFTAGNVVTSIAGTTAGIYTGSASYIGLIIRGAASQTANLQEWQNSAGTVLANIKPDGGFKAADITSNNTMGALRYYWGNVSTGNQSLSYITGSTNAGLLIETINLGSANATFDSVNILTIKGLPNQTGNLQQWQNSAGTVLAKVDSTGAMFTITPADSTNTTQVATTAYVKNNINNLINSAPGALDTLNELAAALGNDASFSTTITNSLALKAPLASPTFTGTPIAPTATSGTNTTQIATTAFVKTAIDTSVQPGAVYQTSAPSSPAVGQIWIDSDDDVTTFDSNIIRRKAITATAGQTVFTADLPFIDGFEQIFMNGLLLVKTTDYATSGGNTVTLTSAAAASDIIEIVSVTGANSINTYTQAETNALLAANTSVAPLSISANTTLVAKKRYFVTSASALTLTLPASPALNDEIQILDASGNSSTYNITVARNASKINGGNDNLIIDTNGGWYTLLYTGSTYGWKVG